MYMMYICIYDGLTFVIFKCSQLNYPFVAEFQRKRSLSINNLLSLLRHPHRRKITSKGTL